MKYIEWCEQFESYLGQLTNEERERALAYYGEMYADMRDSGMTEEDIVAEFGAPYDAAKKIIDEEGEKKSDDGEQNGGNADYNARALFTSAGAVNTFDIDSALGKIYMRFYDGDRVKIDYPTTPFLDYKITERNGRIKITHGGLKFRNISFKIKKMPEMFIDIPRGIAPDCNIGIATGTVELGEGNYGKITACVRAGKLSAGKFTCTEAKFQSDSGKIAIDGVTCANISFEINAGKLDAGYIVGDAAAFEINAGVADCGKADCKRTDIMVNTGKARITMHGSADDYETTVNKSFGSCNLANNTNGRGRKINAMVNMGALNVAFKN